VPGGKFVASLTRGIGPKALLASLLLANCMAIKTTSLGDAVWFVASSGTRRRGGIAFRLLHVARGARNCYLPSPLF
jgi:hypothetical protein